MLKNLISHRIVFSISCLFMIAATGFAQEGPKPKIITAPPLGQVVWTVSFSYVKTKENLVSENKEALEKNVISASDIERIDKIVYTIKKPISSRIISYDGGGKEEAYQYENQEFGKVRGIKNIVSIPIDRLATPDQQFTKKFPGVSWVKPKLFVKVENAYGEPCAIFREAAKVLTEEEKGRDDLSVSGNDAREAWFSIKTGLPVAFKEGDTTGKFNFGDPATANVTIPQDIREQIVKYGAYMEYVKKRQSP